jgi:hypothetical protein
MLAAVLQKATHILLTGAQQQAIVQLKLLGELQQVVAVRLDRQSTESALDLQERDVLLQQCHIPRRSIRWSHAPIITAKRPTAANAPICGTYLGSTPEPGSRLLYTACYTHPKYL